MRINFLNETLQVIEDNNQVVENIIFIGIEQTGEQCTWGTFTTLANICYEDNCTGGEILSDLIIVFNNEDIMRRNGECDGGEWWDFYKKFKLPKHTLELESVLA